MQPEHFKVERIQFGSLGSTGCASLVAGIVASEAMEACTATNDVATLASLSVDILDTSPLAIGMAREMAVAMATHGRGL